jgi:hypothetical protein
MTSTCFVPALAIALSLAAQGQVHAQIDESLATRRWKMDRFWAETYDKPLVTMRGELEDTGENIRIFHWNSEGRIKFDRKDLEPPVWIGYRALTVSVTTPSDLYNHTYSDVGLAVAVSLGSIGDDWTVIATAGAGTANDGRWDNLHALFPVATLEFTGKDGDTTVWHAGLSLDGNRGVGAPYPLPYLMYETTTGPGLSLLLGFPRTEIVVHPVEPLTLTGRWVFPSTASARIETGLGAGVRVFAEASRRIDGFHLRHEKRTRQFFEMNTAEAGLRWSNSWIDLSLSAGYAFGQRFFTGPDLLNRSRGNGVDDLAFIALTLPSTFWRIPF